MWDVDLPVLIPAILWTRKDMREFKDGLRKNPDNMIRVSSLSIATVSSLLTCCFYVNLCIRDVNSREIALPGLEAQIPGQELDHPQTDAGVLHSIQLSQRL